MSAYLSYRRRYSEPEKPEPRFQWRLRVHSLMMSDSDPASALADRRPQRYDSLREYGATSGPEVRSEKRVGDSRPDADSVEAPRHRRERFMRTKSEGHLKLRVRFSKFSDAASKSLDDDESEVYSGSENRRLRSSQESGIDSSKEHPSDEEDDRPQKFQKHLVQFKDNSDADDGFAGEELSGAGHHDGAVGGSEEADDNQINEEVVKDVSKGAIPKRFSKTIDPKLSLSEESNGGERSEYSSVLESALVMDNVDFTVRGGDPITSIENSDTYNVTDTTTCFTSNINTRVSPISFDATTDAAQQCGQKSKDKSEYNSEEEEKGIEEDVHDGVEKRAPKESDKVDDIESIIERIIAEEEAMLNGKDGSPSSEKATSDSLSEEDMSTLKSETKNTGDHAEDGDLQGISIARSVSQDKQRSSSLPSYQTGEDHDLSMTIAQFSSSCPSSQNDVTQEKKAEEEDATEDDGWAYLPVILLEDVFTLLTPKERHQASQVCRQWYDLFYSPRVWETFILLERTLTKKRFNLYKGYQRELCPGKTQVSFTCFVYVWGISYGTVDMR